MFAMCLILAVAHTVPTMANTCCALTSRTAPRTASCGRKTTCLQQGFDARFVRLPPVSLSWALTIEHRRLFVGGFLGFIAVSFLLAFLGRNFFPQSMAARY